MLRSFLRAGFPRGAGTPVTPGMTTPSFHAAGAGNASVGASLAVALPTNSIDDLLVLHGVGYNQPADDPSGWTRQWLRTDNDAFGSQVDHYIWTRNARSSGGESGTETITFSGSTQFFAGRMYSFSGVALTSFLESHSDIAGTFATTVNCPTVTAGGLARLACMFLAGYPGPVADATGASGGTWAEAADYESGVGMFLEIQTADLSGGGAISGGTAALSGGTRMCNGHGFALVGS